MSANSPLSHIASNAGPPGRQVDRKSTRLNSSHANISYAAFCLKKTSILVDTHEPSGQRLALIEVGAVEVGKLLRTLYVHHLSAPLLRQHAELAQLLVDEVGVRY